MNYRLGIVQINVTDISKARAFYINILGFREINKDLSSGVVSDPENGPIFVDSGNGPLVIIYPLRVEKSTRFDYPDQTGTIAVFYVDDIYEVYNHWKTSGVEFIPISWSEEESGIADCPFGKFIAFRDPFGNVHEILEPYNN